MFTQQLFNGVLLGATFCLIALGFNLVVGALDRLNFALGETAMVTAIMASLLMVNDSLPFAVTFVLCLVGGAVLAVLTYFLSFRFVRHEYPTASILSSLGVGLVLTAIVTKLYGSDQRIIPGILEDVRWDLGAFVVTGAQLVILGISALLTVLLYLFLERTVWGTAIRGVSDDAVMTGLLGVPVQRVIVLTFAISGLLAGAAGVLTGLAYHAVSPFDGFAISMVALMVIVIGGLGSITGGVIASILIGVIETLTVAYWSVTARELIVYVLVAIVLLLRPQGLFGRNAGVLERV